MGWRIAAVAVLLGFAAQLCALAYPTSPSALQSPFLSSANKTCPGRLGLTGYLACNGQGICNYTTGVCSCLEPYSGASCAYELRSRNSAFAFSFLMGTWGAGRLYLGYVGSGLMKLTLGMVLMVLPCYPMCCMCLTADYRKLRAYHRYVVLFSMLGLVVLTAWWALDWLLVLWWETDGEGYRIVN